MKKEITLKVRELLIAIVGVIMLFIIGITVNTDRAIKAYQTEQQDFAKQINQVVLDAGDKVQLVRDNEVLNSIDVSAGSSFIMSPVEVDKTTTLLYDATTKALKDTKDAYKAVDYAKGTHDFTSKVSSGTYVITVKGGSGTVNVGTKVNEGDVKMGSGENDTKRIVVQNVESGTKLTVKGDLVVTVAPLLAIMPIY